MAALFNPGMFVVAINKLTTFLNEHERGLKGTGSSFLPPINWKCRKAIIMAKVFRVQMLFVIKQMLAEEEDLDVYKGRLDSSTLLVFANKNQTFSRSL